MNLGFFRFRSSECTECFTSTGKLLALQPGKSLGVTVCTVLQYGHLNTSTRRTVGPSQGGWDSAKRNLQNDTWHLFFWEGTDFSSQWDRWNKSPATAWRSLVKVSFNWACLKTCQGFLPSQMEMNMNLAMSSIRIYGFLIVYTPLCLLVNYDMYIYICICVYNIIFFI